MKQAIIPAWMQPMHDTYHFAPAVVDGDHLRCSGMIGLRPDLTVAEDLTGQFTQAFENLRDLLGMAGLGFADVIEMTTYHVGLAGHIEEFRAVKDAFVSAPYPADRRRDLRTGVAGGRGRNSDHRAAALIAARPAGAA